MGMPPAWRRRRLSPLTQTPQEVHALKLLASNPRLRIRSGIAPRHRRLAVVRAFNRAWACSCQRQGGLYSGNRAQTRGCSKQRVLHTVSPGKRSSCKCRHAKKVLWLGKLQGCSKDPGCELQSLPG